MTLGCHTLFICRYAKGPGDADWLKPVSTDVYNMIKMLQKWVRMRQLIAPLAVS